MPNKSIDELNYDTNIVFRSRPEAIPGDLRPMWRISIILLILRLASRGDKSTFSKLHILNWAIRSRENRVKLMQVVNGIIAPDTIVIRIEPSLDRALRLARAEKLIEFASGSRVVLTNKGRIIADQLIIMKNLFMDEKLFLQEIGKDSLTEGKIKILFSEREHQ